MIQFTSVPLETSQVQISCIQHGITSEEHRKKPL